jgi:cell division protease FtsH
MNLDAKLREDITQKNTELEAIKPALKEEYRGIDDVIDGIIEAIRPFYVFPTSLKRPLVVNLWGLTGTAYFPIGCFR